MNDYTCGMCEFEVDNKCHVLPPALVVVGSSVGFARPKVAATDHACRHYLKSSHKAAEKKRADDSKARLAQIEIWRNAGCCLGCGGTPEDGELMCVSCQEAEEEATSESYVCHKCGRACEPYESTCQDCEDQAAYEKNRATRDD
jgi:hypothetical protein